jgi:predicted nucleic acid-binding protein
MNGEAAIQALLSRLASEEVLGFDIEAAERAGRIHADLERTGQPIGWADTVIAAIALRHDLEPVAGNTGHYQRIQAVGYPLIVLNWRV